jgi:hypothetical protein
MGAAVFILRTVTDIVTNTINAAIAVTVTIATIKDGGIAN